MGNESNKRTPSNRIGMAKLRHSLLLAAADGLTMDEMSEIVRYATPGHAPAKATSGAGFKLERVRISRPGEVLEQQIYRIKSKADALRLIQFNNYCADSWGYSPLSESQAIEILKLYPENT